MAKVYDAIEKDEPYRNQAIRDSAKGERCQVNGPLCSNDHRTVVWCHSDLPEHGKGCKRKAHDIFGCYGCYKCHQWLSTLGPLQFAVWFFPAMHRSWLILVRKGVLK